MQHGPDFPTAALRGLVRSFLGWVGDEFKEENVKRGGDPKHPGRFSKQAGSGKKAEEPKAEKPEPKPEPRAAAPKPPAPTAKAEKGKAGVESFHEAPSEGQLGQSLAVSKREDAAAGLPEKKPGASGELNPLPMPKDYAVRLNRKLGRAAGVGKPNNAAVELAPNMWVGDINLDQWTKRTEAILSDEQVDQARHWYEDALPVYEQYFGKEKGAAMLGAWLIANQNATPAFAQLSAVRTLEQTLNKTPEVGAQKRGGLPHDKLIQYWDSILSNDPSKMPETGQKIYDFIDAAIGKTTRTFYGDDPRAGAPAVADVHSLRDMGMIDEAGINWVRQNYGDDAADKLSPDAIGGGPSETQYEWAADKMRAFTDELNARNYKGGNWTPAQVQAVGWTAMSKMLGRMAQTPEQAITGNIRNLSYELDFGAGAPYNKQFPDWQKLSPEQKTAVGHAVLPKILDVAKGVAGAAEFGRLEGLGGWHEFTNAAFKSRLVASPEVAGDVADVIGYLAQQTKIYGYRYQPSGNKLGIAIQSEALRDPQVAQKLWDGILKEQPDFAAGFSPSIAPDGTYGIEILSDKGGAAMERRLEAELAPAIDRIAKQLNIDVDVDAFRAQEESRENDWETDPTGGSYLSRLSARYGPQIQERLELFKRQELEPAMVAAIAEAQGAGGRGGARAHAGGDQKPLGLDANPLLQLCVELARRGHFGRVPARGDAEFQESNVKRGGDPKHPGRFSKQAGSGAPAKPEPAKKTEAPKPAAPEPEPAAPRMSQGAREKLERSGFKRSGPGEYSNKKTNEKFRVGRSRYNELEWELERGGRQVEIGNSWLGLEQSIESSEAGEAAQKTRLENARKAAELSEQEKQAERQAMREQLANVETLVRQTPPMGLAVVSPISSGFQKTLTEAIAALPAPVMERLKKNKTVIQTGERLTDIRPDLKHDMPRGWDPGDTWDAAEGLCEGNRVSCAEFYVRGDQLIPGRGADVLFHETGHAFDQALADPRYHTARATDSGECLAAYDADEPNIAPEDRSRMAYFLQPWGAGRQEAFAEIFNWEVGGHGTLGGSDVRKWFPKMTEFVRKQIAAA